MSAVRIGIIGLGKIAVDQHIPAIAANLAFEFVAGTTPRPTKLDVPVFTDFQEMLRAVRCDAVVIATPPGPRFEIARACLDAGLDVLLEKPPCSTLGEVQDLARHAERTGRVIFGAWHSCFNDAVRQAAAITRSEGVAAMDIEWLEDAEKWHPGQLWVWQPGGFGVFDAGINALSIASMLCPETLIVERARLTMQEEGQQPAAAEVALRTAGAAGPFHARFDWRHKGQEQWTICIETRAGKHVLLTRGGAELTVDGALVPAQSDEYGAVYAEFARLIAARESRLDAEPLRLVADIMLRAERV